jgi:hypothetical protein
MNAYAYLQLALYDLVFCYCSEVNIMSLVRAVEKEIELVDDSSLDGMIVWHLHF